MYKKYEYATVKLKEAAKDYNSIQDCLDSWGRLGWKLIHYSEYGFSIFIRRMEED